MSLKKQSYGDWICNDCGIKYGKPRFLVSTWHQDKCDYCGEIKVVTESRDFGYPNLPKEKKNGKNSNS
ncbi:MAG TPA: hypothetical protein PLI22_08795 [Caldisericia bacterium]|nr:hypothetical protein [Caldisericia bacterium]